MGHMENVLGRGDYGSQINPEAYGQAVGILLEAFFGGIATILKEPGPLSEEEKRRLQIAVDLWTQRKMMVKADLPGANSEIPLVAVGVRQTPPNAKVRRAFCTLSLPGDFLDTFGDPERQKQFLDALEKLGEAVEKSGLAVDNFSPTR